MTRIDTVVMVDWSARSTPSPAKPTKDAIFIGIARNGAESTTYHRTRDAAMAALTAILDAELRAGRRVLAGFDFPFGYPAGFGRALTGSDDPLALWADLAARIEDDARNRNNRFDVAEAMNARFDLSGPFWGCSATRATAGMLFRKPPYAGFAFDERRQIEHGLPRAKTVFQLLGNGSVGSQALLGLPRLQALRRHFGAALSVSPFQPPDTPIVLAEIYPGLIDAAIKARAQADEIPDAAQVRLMARAFACVDPGTLATMLREGNLEEGWILGFGHQAALIAAL